MQAVNINKGIFWVGVQDPGLKVFDIIMRTESGSSYNAYLVKGNDKTALIDTVKIKFFDEYLERLNSVIDINEIDYLVMNHAEPDHSGSMEKLLQLNPNITVVAHPNTIEFLHELCNCEFKYQMIGNKKELDLGGRTLHFITSILLHWPDNIYCYLKEDKILFSCDSFGSHYSDPRLFADVIGNDFMPDFRYYFEKIMKPFSPHVLKVMKKLRNYEIDMICPGHGPILRSDIQDYINLYTEWATPPVKNDPRPRIVLVYASAYGYTQILAAAIKNGLLASGDFELLEYDLVETPIDIILPELQTAAGLLIGSATINKDAPLPVWDLLSRLSPIEHQNIIASAFGAYGWSGEAVPNIEKRLVMLRMKVLPGLRFRFKPSTEQLEKAQSFGSEFAAAVLNRHQASFDDRFLDIYIDNINADKGEFARKYASKDLIVHWNPERCMHDTNCFVNLPKVFNPEARPWVNMEGAAAVEIIKNIERCPSGALQYSLPEGSSIDPSLCTGPNFRKNK